MAVTALIGKVALVAIAGGAVGSAIAFPVTTSLNSAPPAKEFRLAGKEDYRKYCLFITSDSDRQTIVMACPRDLNSNKVDIYLHKKGNQSFDEVESWNFQKPNKMIVKTTKNLQQETVTLSQNKDFEKINGQNLKDLCKIDWSDGNFGVSKSISCSSWITILRTLTEEDPES